MIIRHSQLKPLSGLMFLKPVISISIVVIMFALHAETKKRLRGQLVHSSVNIPVAETNSFYSVDKIIITMTSDNIIYLDDKVIKDVQDLGQALTELKVGMTTPIVVLWADKDVRYQKIIEVMDSVRKVDLLLLFVTQQKEAQPIKTNFPIVKERNE